MSDTKEAGWTKGEWRLATNADGGWELGIGNPHFNFIVCARGVVEHRAAESIANARLIAAAPDLYEALEALIEYCERHIMACELLPARAALKLAREGR